MTVCWGRGNNQTSQELLDTGSELTLSPGDPQHYCSPLAQVGAYGGQVINGVLAQVHLLVGLCTHPGVISPVLECIIRTILSNWQDPHHGSGTCGVRAVLVGKAKWKPLQTASAFEKS